jgi:hypothetical protein
MDVEIRDFCTDQLERMWRFVASVSLSLLLTLMATLVGNLPACTSTASPQVAARLEALDGRDFEIRFICHDQKFNSKTEVAAE